MKRGLSLILMAVFLLVLCTSAFAIDYYCQWSWPQKITNKDTGAALFTCPSSQPYCKSGTTECCKWTSSQGHYECIDSGIGASEPSSTTTTTPSSATTTTTSPATPASGTSTTTSGTTTIGTGTSGSITTTTEPSADPCATITCTDRTQTCPDGYVARCSRRCDPSTLACLYCSPSCEGHQAAAPTVPATTPPSTLPSAPATTTPATTLPATTLPLTSIPSAATSTSVEQPASKIIASGEQESGLLDMPQLPPKEEAPSVPSSPSPPVSESKAPAGMPVAGSNEETKLNNLLAAKNIGVKDVVSVQVTESKIVLETVQPTRLFGFIPIDMKVSSVYDTGNLLLSSDKPWWGMFGWGAPSPNQPGQDNQNITYYCCNERKGEWLQEKCKYVYPESHCVTSGEKERIPINTCRDKCAEQGMKSLMQGKTEGTRGDLRCECYHAAPEEPKEEEEEAEAPAAAASSYFCCGADEEHLALKAECDTNKYDWKTWAASGVEGPACWSTKCADYCITKGFQYGHISNDKKQCKCLPAEGNVPEKLEFFCCKEAVEGPQKNEWYIRDSCSGQKETWDSVHDPTLFSCGNTQCKDYCSALGFNTGYVNADALDKCVCSSLADNKKYYCCGPSTNSLSITDSCSQNKYDWKTWASSGVEGPACWKTKCNDYCMSKGYKASSVSTDLKDCTCLVQQTEPIYYCCGPDSQHVSAQDSCSQTKFDWKTWDNSGVQGPACWKTKCNDYCMTKGFKSGSISDNSKQCLCSAEAAAGTYYCCGKTEGSAKPFASCADTKFAWNLHGTYGNKFCGPANTQSCEIQCAAGGFDDFSLNSDKTQCNCADIVPDASKGDIYYCCNNKWQYNACASSPEASCAATSNCKDFCAAMNMEGVMEGSASGSVEDRYRCRCKPVPIDYSVAYCCGKDRQHAGVRSVCFYNKYNWETWAGSGIEGDSCWKTNCETLCISKGNLTGTVSADKTKCTCSGAFNYEAMAEAMLHPKYYCGADHKWGATPVYAHEESFCTNTDDTCSAACGKNNQMLGKMAGSAVGQGNDRYRCECYGQTINAHAPIDLPQYKCCVNNPTKPSDYYFGKVWWPSNKTCPNEMQQASTSFCESSIVTPKCANLCREGRLNNTDCLCPYAVYVPWKIFIGSGGTAYTKKNGDTMIGTFGGTALWAYAKAYVNVWSLAHLGSDSDTASIKGYDYEIIEVEGPYNQVRRANITLKVKYAGVIDEANTGVNPALGTGIAGVYSAKIIAGIATDEFDWSGNIVKKVLWKSEYTANQFFFDTVSEAIQNAVLSLIMPEMDEAADITMEVSQTIVQQANSADSCTDSVDEEREITFTNVPLKSGESYRAYIALDAQIVEAAVGVLGVGFTEIDFFNTKPDACDHKGKDIPERGIDVEDVTAVWNSVHP